METNEVKTKCVLVIDAGLPLGLIANTAAILGITLGYKHSNIIGGDVLDASGQLHMGITNIPIPILKADKEKVKELIGEIREQYADVLTLVDFSDVAQSCTDYQDYIQKVNKHNADNFEYLGFGIYGPMKIVNKLTGSMPLLR